MGSPKVPGLSARPLLEWVFGPGAFPNAALTAWRATIYEDERR